MSERDLQRIEVLSKIADGRMSISTAAGVLALSTRQVRRLMVRIRTDGAASIRHRAKGRPSNNRIREGVRDYCLSIVRERYADFGPTLAAEKLAEYEGLTVSRETVRKWMSEAGLWLSRQQRRQFHQPRHRREAYGELVQIDGSDHRWFEDRGAPCSLLVFVDDATGRLMQLLFVPSESTFSYFEALALAYVKELQDQHDAPKVKTNSEKTGYKRRSGQPGRRPQPRASVSAGRAVPTSTRHGEWPLGQCEPYSGTKQRSSTRPDQPLQP